MAINCPSTAQSALEQTHSNTPAVPRVSIGMPVYNGEPFIRQALVSLLAQTYTAFELIISDNASTDGTEEICHEYAAKDKRIRYVRQAENLGASANFKFVLDESAGEFFMWAAHDDLWLAGYLEKALRLLEEDASLYFVFPSFQLASSILPLAKYWPESLFCFVESPDKCFRLIHYMNLHHMSHKCNIVYSLFKKHVISSAQQIQDISNDGLLGFAILGLGRGKHLPGHHFIKRYPFLWPGWKSGFLKYFNLALRNQERFKRFLPVVIQDTLRVIDLVEQDPGTAEVLKKFAKEVFWSYNSHYFCKDFRIICYSKIVNLFS